VAGAATSLPSPPAEGMHRVAHIEQIPPAGEPSPRWRPVRHHLGVAAFGVNLWSAAGPGDEVIEDHVEATDSPSQHQELYLVLSGRAAFTVDGEEVDAPAGTFVFVPDPASRRSAVAREPDTTVLAMGAPAGAPYEVSRWERRHFPDG
jgi:mannose-6-phosphate isomerase-like protein (cupin superfamily)